MLALPRLTAGRSLPGFAIRSSPAGTAAQPSRQLSGGCSAGMGGSPCECLSHATYPDEEAQRGQRAGDSFPVGV